MDQNLRIQKGTSEKLKHFRRISGLSQEGLAAASGVSIRTIQRLEKGLSVGTPYTIATLAKALNLDTINLLPEGEPVETATQMPVVVPLPVAAIGPAGALKLLNLSAITVILLPLSNLIIPAIIFFRNRNNERITTDGRRILSFQLLWLLATLFVMIALPPVMLLLFEPLRGSGIPLFVPVYLASALLNVCLTIRFAIDLNGNASFVRRLPNIL